MMSWTAILFMGLVAVPVGTIALAIIGYSWHEERKQYKYHRVRRERFGDGDCYFACVSTTK